MAFIEKARLVSGPIPNAVLADRSESKATNGRSQAKFANSLTRSVFGRRYVTDRDVLISRGELPLIAVVPSITGRRGKIRFWRAEGLR